MENVIIKIIIIIYMAALSIYDLLYRKIPITILGAGVIAVLIYTVIKIFNSDNITIIFTGIMLGAVPGLLLLLASITTKKAGTADGIVLLMLGMLTDYRSGVRTFCLSMMIAAVFAIITLALKKVGKDSELPYIPFLTVAFAINCLSVI